MLPKSNACTMSAPTCFAMRRLQHLQQFPKRWFLSAYAHQPYSLILSLQNCWILDAEGCYLQRKCTAYLALLFSAQERCSHGG